VDKECLSGHCVESVCCGSSCPTCQSCAIPNHEGTCRNLPAGVEDLVNHCEGVAVCDGSGKCLGVAGHFGDACTQGAADAGAADGGSADGGSADGGATCFNGLCQAGYCKLAIGDACADDVACVTGRCAAGVCASCATGADCASGVCGAGTCALPGAVPCAVPSDCAHDFCLNGYCITSPSGTCTLTGCNFHYCGGGVCETCGQNSDCPNNGPCVNQTCPAPPGSYCENDAECASGQCGPAALLAFPKCM